MIDIVASSLPPEAILPPTTLTDLKRRAFRAIVDAERDKLTTVPELLAALDKELADEGD